MHYHSPKLNKEKKPNMSLVKRKGLKQQQTLAGVNTYIRERERLALRC